MKQIKEYFNNGIIKNIDLKMIQFIEHSHTSIGKIKIHDLKAKTKIYSYLCHIYKQIKEEFPKKITTQSPKLEELK